MTSSDSAAGDTAAYPMRGRVDNQNNTPAGGDAEEGGFTPEWVETHGSRRTYAIVQALLPAVANRKLYFQVIEVRGERRRCAKTLPL